MILLMSIANIGYFFSVNALQVVISNFLPKFVITSPFFVMLVSTWQVPLLLLWSSELQSTLFSFNVSLFIKNLLISAQYLCSINSSVITNLLMSPSSMSSLKRMHNGAWHIQSWVGDCWFAADRGA